MTVTVKLFDHSLALGVQPLGNRTVTLGPRSGTQINRIFDAVGQAAWTTTNAHAVVETDPPTLAVFSYAAVIDNATSDPIFVIGAEDERQPGPHMITIAVRAWDFSPADRTRRADADGG